MQIPNFGVEEWLNVHEKEAVYDLAQSSIDSLTLAEIIQLDGSDVAEFFEKLASQKMNYGWIEGSPAFKEEVAKLYQTVDPANVLQTNGATGANLLALYALIEPGDHVISMLPTYQQLYDIPRSLGAKVEFVELTEAADWAFDPAVLKRLIRPTTKLITLNSANNPTGTLLNKQTLQEIVAIASEVGAYVLVDEVYAPLGAAGEFVSIVDLYEKGIATNSLSKTYSVPGLRIGWTASSGAIADVFRKYRDYTMICCGTLADELAVHVLRNKEKILQRNQKIIADNLQIVKEWVATEDRVSLVVPRNVSTSFIRLELPVDDQTFCSELLKATGVLLVPGTAFDVPGHARLGYCCKQATLQAGLARLSEFLGQYD